MHFRKPRYRKAVFLAHNSKGFDGHILVNAMLSLGIKPELVLQGSKLILFTDPDFQLRFIDSASFLPFTLASLPKYLGFTDSSKGFFPTGSVQLII